MEDKHKNCVTVTYNVKSIDSLCFIASSLSSVVDNLAERLYNSVFLNCKSCLKYIKIKDKLLK